MGQMQNSLQEMLIKSGWNATEGKYARISLQDIKMHGLYDEIKNTYNKLEDYRMHSQSDSADGYGV
jgi:hypothetical protein